MADEKDTNTAGASATDPEARTSDQKAAENKDAAPTPKTKDAKKPASGVRKPSSNATGRTSKPKNTAPTDDGKAANRQETEKSASSERVGETGPERGGVQAIEYDRAQAEAEERENLVEYTEATYSDSKASHLLREIASELGLTRPEDYAELTRLNGIDLNARVDAGEKVRLPKQYSYVDVENVTGGSVKK